MQLNKLSKGWGLGILAALSGILVVIFYTTSPAKNLDNSLSSNILEGLKIAIGNNDKGLVIKSLAQLKKSNNSIPLPIFISEIANYSNELEYRKILADYLDSTAKNIPESEIVAEYTNFVGLISNKDDLPITRIHLISTLTKNYSTTGASGSPAHIENRNEFITLLVKIINDKDEKPEVIAEATHALSRFGSHVADDNLLFTISAWEKLDPLVVKSACENLGRSKNPGAIPIFIDILNNTNNEDIFTTAVYSLGLTESIEMIEPITKNCNRFGVMGTSICKSTLRKNKQLLYDVIEEKKYGPINSAITAIGIIKDEEDLPIMRRLLLDKRYDQNVINDVISQIED